MPTERRHRSNPSSSCSGSSSPDGGEPPRRATLIGSSLPPLKRAEICLDLLRFLRLTVSPPRPKSMCCATCSPVRIPTCLMAPRSRRAEKSTSRHRANVRQCRWSFSRFLRGVRFWWDFPERPEGNPICLRTAKTAHRWMQSSARLCIRGQYRQRQTGDISRYSSASSQLRKRYWHLSRSNSLFSSAILSMPTSVAQ